MAKGVKFGGKIDTAYWEGRINKTKSIFDAHDVLYELLSASTSGSFNIGVSDKDQTNIMNLVNKLGAKYNVDVTGIANIWDPSKNHINSLEISRARESAMNAWDRAAAKAKPSSGSSTSNTNGATSGAVTNGVAGGATSPSSGAGGNYNYAPNSGITSAVDKLEKPKVWTAAELAELYGITDQYNYENILKQYNEATNKYYDDSIATQTEYNDDANRMNTTYANNLIKKYLDSYSTQAPTAVGRGVQAANALANSLNADLAAGEAATSLNNIVNDYQERRKSELENNPLNARTDYNSIGSWLLTQGANMNASVVQQYIDTLNSYATKYAADRNAQATLANAAATAYQNNAQAALATAAYNNSLKDKKYFDYWYGDNSAGVYQNYLNQKNTTNATH